MCRKHGDFSRRQRFLPSKEMSGSSKQTTLKRLSKGNKSNPAETSSDDEVNILYENIYTKFLKKRQCADGTKNYSIYSTFCLQIYASLRSQEFELGAREYEGKEK